MPVPGFALGGDRLQRDQEALDLVGDLDRELVLRADVGNDAPAASTCARISSVVRSVILLLASPRMPARG